jgi:eukaryotic-like serine/threonine-protein kinase
MSFAPGTKLGPYEIRSPLGAGGMGEVYRASDGKLGRDIALKVLPAELAKDPERLTRFRREAKALAQLDHPNIVTIHTVEEFEGVHFLTMQLVAGQPLDRVIPAGGFPVEQILAIGRALGDALAAAHEKGIVHRDLKPANVMVSDDGRVRVLDFGLAKDLRGSSPEAATLTSSNQTQAGVVMGTPAYMSPEQTTGRPLDHRTDIFSLGVMLHEMATGRRPFEGASSAELISAILRDTPPSITDLRPDLPDALARIVRRCLEKDPRDRVQTARDVSNELRELARPTTPKAAQLTPGTPRATPSTDSTERRRRWLPLVVAGLTLAILGALGGYEWRKAGAIRGEPTLAVIGFKNTSGDPKYDWLATELSESLTIELAGSQGIRAVPTDEIASLKNEFSVEQSQSLEREDLASVRQSLGANYLLLGRYAVAPGPTLEMTVLLQDSLGKTIGDFHESGSTTDYRKLVADTASQIREKLGSTKLSDTRLTELQNLYPQVPEASQLYFQALDKLRSFDPTTALSLLRRASDLEPNNVSIHWGLSDAWEQLKHDGEAAQEAQKALTLAQKASLPQEYVVLAQARAAEMNKQWDVAIDNYRSLSALFPQHLNYGLGLASVQIEGSKATDALATLEKLSGLPRPAGTDPRIEMSRAEAYGAMNDYASELRAAQAGLQEAKNRNARMMQAHAELELCWAHRNLGHVEEAYTACSEAQNLFSAFGDNVSAAVALNDIATWLTDRGQYAQAKQLYDRVIQVNQTAGAQKDLAGACVNAARVLDLMGKSDDADEYIKRAIDAALPIGDKNDEALARILRGEILVKQGHPSEGEREVERALTLAREIKSQSTEAIALSNLAEYQSETDSVRALATYREVLHLRREKGDQAAVATCLTNMGSVLFRGGNPGAAERNYHEALGIDTQLKNKDAIAVDLISLAEVDLERHSLRDAEIRTLQAIKDLQESQDESSESEATSILVRVLIAQKNTSAAASQVERIQKIASKDPETDFDGRLSIAAYLTAVGKRDEAIQLLTPLPLEARNLGMNFVSLKARLELVRLQIGRRPPVELAKELSSIRNEAQRAGFGLLLEQAKSLRI